MSPMHPQHEEHRAELEKTLQMLRANKVRRAKVQHALLDGVFFEIEFDSSAFLVADPIEAKPDQSTPHNPFFATSKDS